MPSSLTLSSALANNFESEISSSSNLTDSERRKYNKSRKKSKNSKTKKSASIKKQKNSNHCRFEIIPGKSTNAWDLTESMLGYVMKRFEKYVTENDIIWQKTCESKHHKQLLWGNDKGVINHCSKVEGSIC